MDNGRPVETSSKYQQARRAGIRIVKEDDLFAMVAKRTAPTPRKRSPWGRGRRSSASSVSSANDGRRPDAPPCDISESAGLSPVAPSPLQAAAVRAAGGYPLSLFPESEVGSAKRRKLEMLAGHLVVITDEVLHKVGIPPPVVVDEIESSEDEDGYDGAGGFGDEAVDLLDDLADSVPEVQAPERARRVSFRSGGAGVETVAEVTGPAGAVASPSAASGGGGQRDDRAESRPAPAAAAISPARRSRDLSASVAMKRTDFVLARDVLRQDGPAAQDAREMPDDRNEMGAAAAADARFIDTGRRTTADAYAEPRIEVASPRRDPDLAGWDVASDIGSDGANSTAADAELRPAAAGAAGAAGAAPLCQDAVAGSPVLSTGSATSVPATIDDSQAYSERLLSASKSAQEPQLTSPASAQGYDDADAASPEAFRSPGTTGSSLGAAVPARRSSKSPLVPESPLLSWNPDVAAEAFGGVQTAAVSASAQSSASAAASASASAGGTAQVLVPETQATQRRESGSTGLFVAETQMPAAAAADPAAAEIGAGIRPLTGPLAGQIEAAAEAGHTSQRKVLVPETQPEEDDDGADAAVSSSNLRIMGWLSQSVEAAADKSSDNSGSDNFGAPSPLSAAGDDQYDGGTAAEPTLYTASVAVQSAPVGAVGAAQSEFDESSPDDPLLLRTQQQADDYGGSSPSRSLPDEDEAPRSTRSPMPMLVPIAKMQARQSELRSQRTHGQRVAARPRPRATRGFESSSSDDEGGDHGDENDEVNGSSDAGSRYGDRPGALRSRRAELHARTTSGSNPFAASALLSMNPTQPELAGILRANAAPVPQRKRRRPASPPARPRGIGRRPRPTFSWTDKPPAHLADALSQRDEATRRRQQQQQHQHQPKETRKRKKEARQQRLTSWVAR
jgi:hypothetical protein